jgi:hypothetical protein
MIIVSHGLISCAESFERRFSMYGPALSVGMISEILIKTYCIIPLWAIRSGEHRCVSEDEEDSPGGLGFVPMGMV